MDKLKISGRAEHSVLNIGTEQEPLLIIEDAFENTTELLSQARDLSRYQKDPFYPGIRSPLDDRYLNVILHAFGDIISNTFDVNATKVINSQSFFAIACKPSKLLNIEQRLPHFDSPLKADLAFLLYLCDKSFGGTAFYRHQSSGFEFVDQSRITEYRDSLKSDLSTSTIPEGYPNQEKMRFFNCIKNVNAKSNRLLVYRTTSLHSGDIPAEVNLSPNPDTGRLTITSFLRCAQ